MKKRWVTFLFIIMMFLALTACGDKGPDVTGKYICVGESYFGEALQEPYEESWLELKKGGKGTYYSGFEFDMKWELDGENFSGTVTFLGMDQLMEGTLKDGVLDVKYGDMNIRFVKEGVQAPAGSDTPAEATESTPSSEQEKPERTSLAGYYPIYEAVIEGESMSYEDMEAIGMTENTYLKLYDDGFGELSLGDDLFDSFEYDVDNGLLIFNPSETLPFEVDGDYITVEFEEQDMILTFKYTEEGAAGTSGSGVLASSLAGAFAGVNSFTGVPDEVLSGNWFGWIRESECWGSHDENFQAAWAYANYNSDVGRSYFDLYRDGDSQTPVLSMWREESADDTELIPDIGDGDAWMFETYLTEDEEPLFTTEINADGSLYLLYEYTAPDGASGCLVEIFLRKDGVLWDEANDILPPRYEEYKEEVAG